LLGYRVVAWLVRRSKERKAASTVIRRTPVTEG
jgi:hypothetical protein